MLTFGVFGFTFNLIHADTINQSHQRDLLMIVKEDKLIWRRIIHSYKEKVAMEE